MEMKNNTPKNEDNDVRGNIRKRVIGLEKYNYLNPKEFTSQQMIEKIKKIIESEVNKQ